VLKASKSTEFVPSPEVQIDRESDLISYMYRYKEPVVQEEVKQKAQDFKDNKFQNINELMEKIDAAVIVPSFIENRLIAFVVLGKKKSGEVYSQDDLVVFSILANQSALAIENAQFYEDMKKTQEQLFKAEKMATIGTMADGLSHQINNRLHAMGFIAGDALDTLRFKKKKKLSKEMQELVDDMEYSLKKIEDNVKQGGEIVEGLLKYTRKGEEGFIAVNFDSLISAAIEMVQFKIKLDQIEIVKNYDTSTYHIKGNFTQLQEVFFNIIDNSYDAMMQRKSELKEEGYKPILEITAEKRGKNMDIIMKDNGMGVKKEDIHKLFTPFFTTKLSSKKGTGLGLYVIRQIIEENHGGRVRFSSEFKQGSQTLITLPVFNEKDKAVQEGEDN